jgi:hypothetical protein
MTDVSLKEYFEKLLIEQDKRITNESKMREQQYVSAQQAIHKESDNITLRLEAHNGLLAYLEKQQNTLVRKEAHDDLSRRLAVLEQQRDMWKGGASALWAAGGAIVALLATWSGIFK